MNSETELESHDEESEEDMTNSETEDNRLHPVIDELDSRLFLVLGHDVELAARLIPLIHARLRLGVTPEDTEYTTSPTHVPTGAEQGSEPPSGSSATPGGSSPIVSRQRGGRKRGGSENHRDDDDSKARRKRTNRSVSRGRNFACPFHKKDPITYCPSKYATFRVCTGPGFPELRRIK
jgi:hypothetical protein